MKIKIRKKNDNEELKIWSNNYKEFTITAIKEVICTVYYSLILSDTSSAIPPILSL